MNTVWFTSDTHYYHKNIIEYSKRPFSSVDEMNERMIENHNDTVRPGDTVYFLGDFCFADDNKARAVLMRLNGNKNLILGNHDKNIRRKRNSFLGPRLFTSIQDYQELNVDGQFIVLFHYGCRTWNRAHRGSWLLFGHSHGSLPPFGKSVDVGVDSKAINDEYRPVSFGEVKTFMDTRGFESIDHHGDD